MIPTHYGFSNHGEVAAREVEITNAGLTTCKGPLAATRGRRGFAHRSVCSDKARASSTSMPR